MNKKISNLLRSALALGAVFGFTAGVHGATVGVPKYNTTSQNWVASNTYLVTEISYITSGATLTIEPGTVIIGSGTTAGNPGTVVISRGAKIIANGTAANPIIMTSGSDTFVPGGTESDTLVNVDTRTSQWGGLVVLGRTFVSRNNGTVGVLDDDGATNNIIEGIATDNNVAGGGHEARAGYGGMVGALARDDDDSGSMQYLSIRYGGVGLAVNQEVNGITLGGVGRETDISHIEIVNNLDDGIEFFGGTVNVKYIALYGIGDDGFDWDEGYRGKGQFVFLLQTRCRDAGAASGSGIPDKGGELDGAGTNDANPPYSIPTIYNATFVGMGVDYPGANAARNTAMHFRDNSGGRFRNSLFLDFYHGLIVEDELNPGSPRTSTDKDAAARSVTNYNPSVFGTSPGGATVYLPGNDITNSKELELRNSIWWAATGSNGVHGTEFAPDDFAELTPASDGSAPAGTIPVGDLVFGDNSANLSQVNGAGNIPIVSLARREYKSLTAGGVGDDYQILTIDPRANGAATTSTLTPPADGFYSPVSYKGAVSPTKNWMAGWTLMDNLGLFTSPANPADPTATDPVFLFSFEFATTNGVVYEIGASTNPAGPFSPIGSVVGDGSTVTYVDGRALTARQFYSVTAQ